MSEIEKIEQTLYNEVRSELKKRVSKARKKIKEEFKPRSKYLNEDEQRSLVKEMKDEYFSPYLKSSQFPPTVIKLTPTNFQYQLEYYSEEGLLNKYHNQALKKELINRLAHIFHFAEMHEFFNKLKFDISNKKPPKSTVKKTQYNFRTIQRRNNDRLTDLTAKQSGLLKRKLQENRIFLGDGYLDKEDIYRITKVTTGYGKDLVKEGYNMNNIEDTDKLIVGNKLKKIGDDLIKSVK
ncbi:hypothetical protein PZB74_10625 [Porifericola rhodea]|uniref:hypothetical protein n=1 Tax=Porifericola rhodea TaxID=930972 RepID=UPI00266667FC|nr:hypothetical protein [Porifericola rhodea]WKN33778.1 hypothetical protein PZB74_10625 [Porifericola rhodea]